jgi:hypothetical protein
VALQDLPVPEMRTVWLAKFGTINQGRLYESGKVQKNVDVPIVFISSLRWVRT